MRYYPNQKVFLKKKFTWKEILKNHKFESIKKKLKKIMDLFIYFLNVLILIYLLVHIDGNLQKYKESETRKIIFAKSLIFKNASN